MDKDSPAIGIVVLGMHRSGTSAAAGALALLGLQLGNELVGAGPDNPTGYFENSAVVRLNERVLARLGSSWEDPRELPESCWQAPELEAIHDAARQVLAVEYSGSAMWLLKDPRMCRLLPFWSDALRQCAADVSYVVVGRDPEAVVGSLVARDRLAEDHARHLWLQHMREAERNSRGGRRAFIEYDDLLANPVRVLSRVADQLGLRWPRAPEACAGELQDFLDPQQRHHRAAASKARGAGPLVESCASVYRVCAQLAAGADTWSKFADALASCPPLPLGLQEWSRGLVTQVSLARARADAFEARIALTDATLRDVEQVSMRRLTDLKELDSRLAQTDHALASVDALAVERLERLQSQNQRLNQTDAALAEIQQQARERLAQVEELDARLRASDRALADSAALALQRLSELKQMDARLLEVDSALSSVEATARARLRQIEGLQAQHDAANAMLLQERQLCSERHAAISALEVRLGQVNELLILRVSELVERDAALAQRDAALAQRDAMLAQRGAMLAQRDAALAERDAALAQQGVELQIAALRLEGLSGELEQILHSRSWRITRPLRWLSAWLNLLRSRLRGGA